MPKSALPIFGVTRPPAGWAGGCGGPPVWVPRGRCLTLAELSAPAQLWSFLERLLGALADRGRRVPLALGEAGPPDSVARSASAVAIVKPVSPASLGAQLREHDAPGQLWLAAGPALFRAIAAWRSVLLAGDPRRARAAFPSPNLTVVSARSPAAAEALAEALAQC